ncbi:hypothetical protein [Clostridium botulinum]|uniref:hypothetical protein n=1 Tax=Clostridium botulinum TaxID=1491 RepID=UPI001A9C9A4E|nr:hypothetical protein [Clostridium botulinum]
MNIEKDVENNIRSYICNLNDETIEKKFNEIKSKFKEFSDFELVCYALLSIENEFVNDSFRIDSGHKNAAINRTILEWFIKMLLKRNIKKRKFEFNQSKYDKFGDLILENVILCGNYLLNDRFKQKHGIEKFLIEIDENNEYYFKKPNITDKIDCQETYYWSDFNNKVDEERESANKAIIVAKAMFKYVIENSGKGLSELISLKEIDNEIYNLCKINVEVDVNKISNRFSSKIFKSKNELIGILGVFTYLSIINILENQLLTIEPIFTYEKTIVIKNEKLLNSIKKFITIEDKRVEDIIKYFTIDSNQKWAFNEYPLIRIDNYILWTPSSFIMNDFQFSIVNGHYEKGIKIIDRDKTVSRKLVNNIADYCGQFKNIVIAKEVKYHDKNHLYYGKELDSDIDVAIYDVISNSVLIIECKWTEKLFYKTEMYEKICKYVKEIYDKQIYKHKYFLHISEENINFVFKNDERVLERPYYPTIEYIMVDKRVQLHYENKHLLSEFNLYEIINCNVSNGILKLDNVISQIKTLNTEVLYSIGDTISKIQYDGKIINNSLFSLI